MQALVYSKGKTTGTQCIGVKAMVARTIFLTVGHELLHAPDICG